MSTSIPSLIASIIAHLTNFTELFRRGVRYGSEGSFNTFLVISWLYFLLVNGGPLSDTTTLGNLNLVKISLNNLITALTVVVFNIDKTSSHLEVELINTWNVLPRRDPKKSK